MTEEKKGKHTPKTHVEEKFLELLDDLRRANSKNKTYPYTDQHFCEVLNVHGSYINGIKRGRSLDVVTLVNFCKTLGLDLNQFCYDDAPMMYRKKWDESPASQHGIQVQGAEVHGNLTQGDNNKVYSVEHGVIEGDVRYEQFADQIINKCSPEVRGQLEKLVAETTRIKKMAFDYKQEVLELRAQKNATEGLLQKSNKELHALKDELLAVFRSKQS